MVIVSRKTIQEGTIMLYMEHKELQRFLTDKQIGDLECAGAIEWIEYHEHFWIHDDTKMLELMRKDGELC